MTIDVWNAETVVVEKKCFIADCFKIAKKDKYCFMHRARIKRHGNPNTVKTPRRGKDTYACQSGIFHRLHGKMGEQSFNWKGGSRTYINQLANKIYRQHHLLVVCERCGASKNIAIHHRDRNRRKNNLNNLEALCFACHTREHHFGIIHNPVGYNQYTGKKTTRPIA